MDIELFTGFFRDALNYISDDYYGRDGWIDARLRDWAIYQDHPQWQALKNFLSRYSERVFCYELYHQIRVLMDMYLTNHPPAEDNPIICLQAELKKEQVGEVIDHFPEIEEALVKEYMPDFLLHSPIAGDFRYQMVVVEVKSDPELTFTEIKADLSKIQEFITRYHYRRGIFLTVNTPQERMQRILARNRPWIQANLEDRDKILFMCKQRRNTPLYECFLV